MNIKDKLVNIDTDKIKKGLIKAVEDIDAEKIKSGIIKTVEGTEKVAKNVGLKTNEIAVKTKEEVVKKMDQNGDGQIGIEDIIMMGIKIPGISVNREAFLRREFQKKYSNTVIENAIALNPTKAGIKREDIDKIAEDVIEHERLMVSGISAVLGTPGGAAMVATIPTDISQYYGYMLRVTQELLYLYGFQEIDTSEENGTLDSETMNILIICFGVMYGVAGANNALKSLAVALGKGVEKQLVKKALAKGAIYPIVKSVSKWFGVRMTKDIFAGFFKKAIPLVGGAVGGGLTYLTFKPCCAKLQNSLKDTYLTNPNYVIDESQIIDIA